MSPRSVKLLLLTFAVCALLAAATPTALQTRGGTLSCPNGKNTQCCKSTERYAPNLLGFILGLLGLTVEVVEAALSVTGLVGITCTPLDIGILNPITLSEKCKKEAVCCTNLDLHGLITVGCVPIEIL